MGIFSRMETRNLSVNNPKAWDRSLWSIGPQSISGENVNEETALTYSAVWNAVELISSTIAALPLNLMQGSGKTERLADDNNLNRVMHNQWNPYMTAKRGRETQIAHVLTWGNGYAEIVRNGYGAVAELWPIIPERVRPSMKDGKLIYTINMPNGENVDLPYEKVLNLIGPSKDGFTGYSRIGMARKNIGLGMGMETFSAEYFGQGIHPSMAVTMSGSMKDPVPFKKAFNESYGGLSNAHRVMLLEETQKIEKFSIQPEDAQFIQSKQHHISDIARFFNIPPHKLKDLTKSSFNNIESEDASYLRDRILPDLVDLEQSYDMQLLTQAERSLSGKGRLFFKHNVKGLLRADTAARTALYTAMLDRGVFCIDDVLNLEEMPPLADDLGQKRFVQANMTLLEDAGKEPEPPKIIEGKEDEDEETTEIPVQ